MLKNLLGAAAVILGVLLFSNTVVAEPYQVKVGDTLRANGYCDTEAAALDLYYQIAKRAPDLPLTPPAACHPDHDMPGVIVDDVLHQAPSIRNANPVVLFKNLSYATRWYIGFVNNVVRADSGSEAKVYGFTPVQLTPTNTTVWMAGESVTLEAYCNSQDEQLVRGMSAAFVNGGVMGYLKWVNGDHPCWDSRLPNHYQMGVRAVRGTLLEKLWTIKTDTESVEIWRFKDGFNQFGFTWLAPKPVPGNGA